MTIRTFLAAASAAASLCIASGASAAGMDGASAPLGNGTATAYAVIGAGGAPTEIGVRFSAGAFDGLPDRRNATSRCFDLNGDGQIAEHGECEGDYESSLTLPGAVTGRTDIPFTFAMVNWNPEGHEPEAWAPPHFDVHFYREPLAEVDAMAVGPCGIFIDCKVLQSALMPVDPKYVAPNHVSVGAAVGRMGNHLIDVTTPELGNPPVPFTHTWIYGAYAGKIIFDEVMATRDYLAGGPEGCHPVRQPQAWAQGGYYPTQYCFAPTGDGGLKVYMAGFKRRNAS